MGNQGNKRAPHWLWASIGGAVAVQVLAILLLRVPADESRRDGRKASEVVVIPGDLATRDQLARERVELLDPAPLIAPTRWNAGAQALPAELRRQPGEDFDLVRQERMTFPADRLGTVFGPPGGAPSSPPAVLAQQGSGLAGWGSFGRSDRPLPRLPVRDAGIEISSLAGGPPVVRDVVSGLPERVRERDWEPLEFSVVVASDGVVGEPAVAESSGIEAVDGFFRDFLVREFRVGERLPPGIFRVVIVR